MIHSFARRDRIVVEKILHLQFDKQVKFKELLRCEIILSCSLHDHKSTEVLVRNSFEVRNDGSMKEAVAKTNSGS